MKVMNSFTVRSLVANKVRTGVTIVGVALAATLLVGVLGSYSSLISYLYNTEVALNGAWMSSVMLPWDSRTSAQINAASESSELDGFATIQDVGFADLDETESSIFGDYLPIMDAEGDVSSLCGISASEGRMPEGPDEIILSSVWKNRMGFDVGDTLSVDVGQRQAIAVADPSDTDGLDGESGSYYSGYVSDGRGFDISDNSILNSSTSYFDSELYGSQFDERLIDIKPMEFKVVGFYNTGYNILSTAVGYAGVTTGMSDAPGYISCFMAFKDVFTNNQIYDATKALFGDVYVRLHTNLLRYEGIVGHGAIWDTFFAIVAILAAVIMAACISLIYNAFAISVAERIRQFGLLSSIGASKRQLRQSVCFEACVMALIGIPLGIAVGLGGTAVVLAALGPALDEIFGGNAVPFRLDVRLWVIGATIAVTALTVIVSAWIPARRAAKASPVSALRQNAEIKLSRSALKGTHSRPNLNRLWGRRGWQQVFGVGGQVARLEKKRNRSRGRGASISLALAIVLLMMAGSLNTQLGTLTGVAGQYHSSDLGLYMAFEEPSDSSGVHAEGRSEALVSAVEDIYTDTLDLEDIEGAGWNIVSILPISVPKDAVGNAITDTDAYVDMGDELVINARFVYMPEDRFEEYARANGVDYSASSAAQLPAIAVRDSYGNNGSEYTLNHFFESTGGIRVVSGALLDGAYTDDIMLYSSLSAHGEGVLELVADTAEDAERAKSSPKDYVALEQAQLVYTEPDILGLAENLPENFSQSSVPTMVLPVSAVEGLPFKTSSISFTAYYNAADHVHAAEEIEKAASDFAEAADLGNCYINVQDYIAEEESGRMLVTVVNVFCFLFAFILTLIAMANVFNTVTNGLILRRREFAVMRSVGMGNRAFRNMIAAECASYSVRGLIPGIIMSVIVSVLLFQAVGLSVSGMQYVLPWKYLVLSVAMVAVILVVSVMYGMHRCSADNLVEALRQE